MNKGESDDFEQTGSLCRHRSALGECDEICLCGHACGDHDGESEACNVRSCRCEAYVDA